MRRFLTLLVTLLVFGAGSALGQVKQVTGVVTSADDKQPIPGVGVYVKEFTSVGTSTDVNGKYTLKNIPANAKTIVFRAVGYAPMELPIKATLDVALQAESQKLDEVMVVAFGTAKKASFTGSAAVVKGEQLAKIQTSNISNALAGVAPGVQTISTSGQPGASASIRIRGIGSINSSSEPLIILDGVPFDGNLNSINPTDIESLTVLKDAASNSLYGARGANGVVMVTTKKGKQGEAKVTFDAKIGVNTRGIKEYDIMKSPQKYYEKYWEALYNQSFYTMAANKGDAAKSQAYASGELIKQLGYNVYNVADDLLIGADGKLNPKAQLGNNHPQAGMLLPDNWGDEMFGEEMRQEYNASVSGGTEKLNYYMSFGYLNDKGYVVNSDFDRYSARLSADYQAKKWLKVGGSAAYINASSKSPDFSSTGSDNMFYVSRLVAPIYPLYMRDSKGNILHDVRNFPVYDYGDGVLKRPFMGTTNPLGTQALNKEEYASDIFNGKGYADISFLDDFKFSFKMGLDNSNRRSLSYLNDFYGQYAGQGGIGTISQRRQFGINIQELLTWTKNIGDHSLDVLVGHETYSYKYQYVSAGKQNFLLPDAVELSGAIKNPNANSFTREYKTEGYLGRIQYDYLDRYYLTGSYRRDASSKFHPDNRWGNFWSVGASWRVSEEEFMKEITWVNSLKLKASYGAQGNDALLYNNAIIYTPYMDLYEVVNSSDQLAINLYYKGNKDITWESNFNFNTGVEFSLLDSRINGNFEFFTRTTKDMLFYLPQPISTGVKSYPANIGDMRNIGFEGDINGDVVKTKDLRWNLALNFSHFKNKILSLPSEFKKDGIISGRYRRMEGGSIYDFYLRDWAGVNPDTGAPTWWKDVKDANGNKTGERVKTEKYDEATLYDKGSSIPDLYGGINTTFEYKGFDLSVFCTYQIGGQMYDWVYATLMSSGDPGNNWHNDILKSWTPQNKNSNIPRVEHNENFANGASSRFLTDASYFSIQNITLGYTVPKQWSQKIGLASLRFYGVIDNVALSSKRRGMDPRQDFGGETDMIYSPIRTISGGVTINF